MAVHNSIAVIMIVRVYHTSLLSIYKQTIKRAKMTKSIIIAILLLLAGVFAGCQSNKVVERDYSYEAYCDSIWENNPDYYMDILEETDEYCTYIEKCGIWWE